MEPHKKLALVTGASAGIGEAFARAYARRGLDVALVARRADRLQALAGELASRHGVNAYVIAADLAEWEAHEPILARIAELGRRVDVLVNNAGFGTPQDYVHVPWKQHRDFLMTLVVNACGMAYGVAGPMAEAGSGSIINVASMVGFAPGAAGYTLYPAAKSFTIKLSQSLDAELRARGVRVTALCPGSTRTEFNQVAEGADAPGPRLFVQTAAAVAEAGIRANEAGKVIEVPAWWNKAAVLALTALPGPLVTSLVQWGAAKARVKT